MKHSALERMKQGSALKKGISVEKEHKDLYNELKKRLKEQGVIMPITEEQFYAKIAKAHLKERKDYYDLLEKYVEKYGNKKKMHKGGDFDLHSTTTNYDNLQPGDKVFTILGPYANGNKYYGIVDVIRPTELYITFYDAKTDKKVSGSEQMVYDYTVPYYKHIKDMKKNGGDLKQRMFDAGYVKKPDFISEEVSISALPYKKSFFDRFTHEYETLNGFSEDQWREYAHYLKKKDLALRYDKLDDAYIITNPHGEGKFYGTSQYATFENGGLVDAMRNNIPKLQAALDNPTLSETAKKNIKERLDYLNKVVTGYDAFREQRSIIKPTPAPAEPKTEIKEEVVTEEGKVDSAPVSIESAPKTGEQKYYIIVELDVKQKVKDALWYRNISYTTVRQPGGANMLIVEGKDNLDIAYEVYSKYREKLGHGGKRKESVTGIYDPSQHRMVAEDGMMIGSQPFRYYWRYKTTLAKDKGMYVKSKFFRTQEEAKKFVSDHKDIITNAFMYDVLQNRKLVLTYKKGVFEIGDMREKAKHGKELEKDRKLTTEQQAQYDKLTSKEKRIYDSVMSNFPATPHESALDAALQGGKDFQFYPRKNGGLAVEKEDKGIEDLKNEIVEFVISPENEKQGAWSSKIIQLIEKHGFDKVYNAYSKGVVNGELSPNALEELSEYKDEDEKSEMKKGGSPKGKFTICPVGTKIQTLIFNKDNFTKKQAKDWAKKHDERYGFVDEKENTYRIRQREPETFVEDSFRTITLTKGVKGVIGCPKK